METPENRSNGNGQGQGPPPAQAGPGAPVATPGAGAAATRRKKSAKTAYLILGGLAAAAVAAYYIHGYMTRNIVSTDDAQIDADVIPIAPRVAGVISEMKVHDNDLVRPDPKTKDLPVVAVLDPRDIDARLAAATADEKAAHSAYDQAQLQVAITRSTSPGGLSSAKAQIAGSSAAAQAATAGIAAAQAQIERAKSDLAKADSDLARAQTLHDQGAITGKELQDAQHARDNAKAMVDAAQAGLANARGMAANASAQVAAAQGKLEQTTPVAQQIDAAAKASDLALARWDAAKAQLALASLQKEYATVRAPTAGYVSRLAAHDGQLVQPGQTLMMLVPSDTYVIANFKETQIDRIKPGQKVDISVDAIPGKTFEGVVDSLAPGTGARFSLLPPDNATGNFVKVVQRVPVKIKWTSPPGAELRAGLSAEVTIHLE